MWLSKIGVPGFLTVLLLGSLTGRVIANDDIRLILTVEIEQRVYFDGVNGPVEPGIYMVEHLNWGYIELIPEEGESVQVPVIFGGHDEDISDPVVLPTEAAEDEFRLVVLLPGGTTLDAAGSYSGIRSRSVNRFALSKRRIASSYKVQQSNFQRKPVAAYRPAPAGIVLQTQQLSVQQAQLQALEGSVLQTQQASAGSVLLQQALQPKPDLAFTGCQINLRQSGCGAPGTVPIPKFTVNTSIKNIGPEPATLNENMRIVRWDNAEEFTGSTWVKYGPPGGRLLMPGEEINISNYKCIGESTELGDYFYTYLADPNGHIAESNEHNNQQTCKFTVTEDIRPSPPKADLQMVSVVVEPTVGSSQTLFSFRTSVKNVGSISSSARVICTGAGDENLGTLAPNQSASKTLQQQYYMPPGDKSVTCTVSGGEEDSNPSNNSKTVAYTVE